MASSWHKQHGLALADPELLGARIADVEATIGVAPAPMEVFGRNGELSLEGAAALDWQSSPLRRNAPGCRGACQCAIGCPNNAKGGVHLNALPQACEAGARIVSGLHVRQVLSEGGRAAGVAGGGPTAARCGSRPRSWSSPPARSRPRRCCAAAGSADIPASAATSRSTPPPGSRPASRRRWCPGAA